MSITAAAWDALTAELDLWAAEGRQAHFWWRDDDATQATAALDRLLALQRITGIPLALAVIPAQLQDSLVQRLATGRGVVALQHGHAHTNHAGTDEKKSEFPLSRALEQRRADIQAGRDILRRHAQLPLLPIFVPPWNRIGADCLPVLAALGFTAISAFAPRRGFWAAPGLARLNTHLDPIDWHGSDNAAGAARSLAAAVGLLRAMRHQEEELQPLGLLTHHLRHDAMIWEFTERFLAQTSRHPAVRWVDVQTAGRIAAPHTAASPAVI